METETLTVNGVTIAVVNSAEKITTPQSALDLAVTVKYETGAQRIAIPKKLLPEEFFILSSGLAGEILQKYINYGIKMAAWGDFSRYTSKPLQDFIRESNEGKQIFFPRSEDEALERLAAAE